MNLVRLIPVLLSAVLLAAHFLRAGNLPLLLLSLGFPLVLLVARRWAARLVQGLLLLGALEWIHTLLTIAVRRQAAGEPWLRAAVILGVVAAFTAGSALVFRLPALRKRYKLAAPPGAG